MQKNWPSWQEARCIDRWWIPKVNLGTNAQMATAPLAQQYLELYALSAAVLTWSHLLENQTTVLFCDNTAMVGMVNSMTSSCKNCMYLLRLITLNNLIHNRRIYAKYISMMDNYLSDALSRLQFTHFWKLAPRGTNKVPSEISPLIWPVTHIWIK